ncbi:MAG TPA: hypothetical protein VNE62_05240 [Actinomycetota bacterium]|nr:hypothetical protein [Actinomycetota bacterium]
MSDPNEGQEQTSRDAQFWSKPVSRLNVSDVPAEALNRNVEGRRVVGPMQGFGKMWQKTYRTALPGVTVSPQEVIAAWKQNFGSFWPEGNRFYGPLTGIAPGDVAVLNLKMPGKLTLSTGVLVLYADDESFTLMTPEGHMLAGWITFSAFEADGTTTVQTQVLMRGQNPLTEVALGLGGHRKEDRFWQDTLTNVARHFGTEADVQTEAVCVDRKRQWKMAGNIWQDAGIRSGLYMMGAPFRWMAKPFRRRRDG